MSEGSSIGLPIGTRCVYLPDQGRAGVGRSSLRNGGRLMNVDYRTVRRCHERWADGEGAGDTFNLARSIGHVPAVADIPSS